MAISRKLLSRVVAEWKALLKERANAAQGTELRDKLDAIYNEAFPLLEEIVDEGKEAVDDDLIIMAMEILEKRCDMTKETKAGPTRDELVKDIIQKMLALKTQLDALPPGDEQLNFGPDLRTGINKTITGRLTFTYPQELGLKPRPTRAEEKILQAERNLTNQKEMLANVLKQRDEFNSQRFSLKDGLRGVGPTEPEVNQAHERVRLAEKQLAQAKGLAVEYSEQQKAEAKAKLEAEREEYARAIAGHQRIWREFADKQRQKNKNG